MIMTCDDRIHSPPAALTPSTIDLPSPNNTSRILERCSFFPSFPCDLHWSWRFCAGWASTPSALSPDGLRGNTARGPRSHSSEPPCACLGSIGSASNTWCEICFSKNQTSSYTRAGLQKSAAGECTATGVEHPSTKAPSSRSHLVERRAFPPPSNDQFQPRLPRWLSH